MLSKIQHQQVRRRLHPNCSGSLGDLCSVAAALACADKTQVTVELGCHGYEDSELCRMGDNTIDDDNVLTSGIPPFGQHQLTVYSVQARHRRKQMARANMATEMIADCPWNLREA